MKKKNIASTKIELTAIIVEGESNISQSTRQSFRIHLMDVFAKLNIKI